MLTERAARYLKSLYREERVPTLRVEQMLKKDGGQAFPAWLDFHEKYAGYMIEVAPGDLAILGLARLG